MEKVVNSRRMHHGHQWTFLSNHGHVLISLAQNPEQPLREVAIQVGITERAVQRIVSDLEGAGYLERSRIGRQNLYRIHFEKNLRHPLESHCTIGDVIETVRQAHADKP